MALDLHAVEAVLAAVRSPEAPAMPMEGCLDLLAEHVDQVLWVVSATGGGLLYVNAAYERVWQRSCASVYADPASYLECVVPEDVPRVLAANRHQADTGFDIEYRIRRPDGGVRWIRDRAFPVRDATGRPSFVVGISDDVTERHLAAESLHRREQELRAVVARNPDLIVRLDHEGRVLYVNEALLELGYLPEHMVGQRLSELPLATDLRDRLGAALRGVLESAGERVVEFSVRTPAGVRHFQSRVVPERVRDRAVQTVLAVSRDITTHRWTEEALLRGGQVLEAVSFAARHLLRAATWQDAMDEVLAQVGIATGADRVYIFENERRPDGVLLTSQRFEWVAAGISAHLDAIDLQGATFEDLGLADWPERLAAGALITGRSEEFSPEARSQFERQGIQSLVVVPIAVQGRWWGMIGLDQCRYARGWAAVELDALRAAADTLGAAIQRQQTEEALRRSEEQLRQSQKMEAVGRLAGGIAHDFNNMLTAISGFAALLRSEMEAGDDRAVFVEEIQKAASRSADLTRQLLAYSRQQVRQVVVVDLNDVVRRLQGMVQRLIGENVVLHSDLAPGTLSIEADPVQLEQVVMNLLINARDAMPQGGTVTIRSWIADGSGAAGRPGRWAALSVADTGHGMDAATAARAFEPFFTTKGIGEGTGLGLATVHGIVEQSGGFIDLDTAPGEGTTFRLFFPAVAVPDSSTPRAVVPTGPVARGSRILVVDDEPALRALTRRVLEARGYDVRTAASAEDALRAIEEERRVPDLLLTDVMMPGIGGPELAAQVRRLAPALPVLFMSGFSDAPIENGVSPTEVVELLCKPFTPDALVDRVARLLRPVAAAA